jgi:hypothetical protein
LDACGSGFHTVNFKRNAVSTSFLSRSLLLNGRPFN